MSPQIETLPFRADLLKTRIVWVIAAAVAIIAGLASRRYREYLPSLLADYAGDTLWSLVLFLAISTLMTRWPVLVRATIGLALAFLVEISQLYHAPWIDSIRRTTLGGLVLGFGFLWTDLVCYSLGISIGALAELGIRRLVR
ncbi:MAG: DUF2809 domain-containing protein [Pirellula sp.]